jgi:hypothetical protein
MCRDAHAEFRGPPWASPYGFKPSFKPRCTQACSGKHAHAHLTPSILILLEQASILIYQLAAVPQGLDRLVDF